MNIPNEFKDFDKVTFQYYIEKANLTLDQIAIEMIQNYLSKNYTLERSINLTAGIINSEKGFQLQEALYIAHQNESEYEFKNRYEEYLILGFSEEDSINKALNDII